MKDQRVTKACERCGTEFKCSPSHAPRRKNCSLHCSNHGRCKNTGRTWFKKGRETWNNNGGSITAQGYRVVYFEGKQVLEHRKIWIEHNSIEIPEGYHVHHKDGDKLNNDIDNLTILSDSEHQKLHLNLMKGGNKIMENKLIVEFE